MLLAHGTAERHGIQPVGPFMCCSIRMRMPACCNKQSPSLQPEAKVPLCRAEWDRIGDVMSGEDSNAEGGSVQVGSKMYNGQEWDFVFDVDVEDGMPVKRLPYNRHENPYDAADRYPHPHILLLLSLCAQSWTVAQEGEHLCSTSH